MKKIQLYTDGACSGNPGRGGWSAVAFNEAGDNIMQTGEGYRHTTNNRMEIMAVAKGLRRLHEQLGTGRDTDIKVTVFSDSQLVVNTMKNGWARKSNKDLWGALDKSVGLFSEVTFEKVKGHADNSRNNLADEVAVAHSQPDMAKNIDWTYEGINAYAGVDAGNFATNSVKEPEITEIRLKNASVKELREVEVYLTNGTIVKITGLYGGFEQFNCTTREAAITLDVATRFCKWLNGENL